MNSTQSLLYDADLANVYDKDSYDIYKTSYKDILRFIPSDFEVGSCLDIGIGTGSMLSMIDKLYTPGTLYGLDISSAMLDKACFKIPRLTPIHGDYQMMGTDARLRGLDLILANYVLSYTQPKLFLELANHALAKDGLFVVATTTLNSFHEIYNVSNSPLFKLLSIGYPVNPSNAKSYLPPNPDNLDHLCGLLKDTGFKVLDTKVNTYPLSFKHGRDLFDFGYEGGWLITFFKQLNLTERSIRRIHYSMRLCQFLGLLDKPCKTSLETCIVVATK